MCDNRNVSHPIDCLQFLSGSREVPLKVWWPSACVVNLLMERLAMISKGDTVKFRCRGFFENGDPLDPHEEESPFVMRAGMEKGNPIGRYISHALIGMRVNDSCSLAIPPEHAFGQYDPALRMQLPRSQCPSELGLGDILELRFEKGNGKTELKQANVVKVGPQTVEVDLNHQLAGEKLVFKISILDVEQKASAAH